MSDSSPTSKSVSRADVVIARSEARQARIREAELRERNESESVDDLLRRISEAKISSRAEATKVANAMCAEGVEQGQEMLKNFARLNDLTLAEQIMFQRLVEEAATEIVQNAQSFEDIRGLNERDTLKLLGYGVYTIDGDAWAWRKGSGLNVVHSADDFSTVEIAIRDAVVDYEASGQHTFFRPPRTPGRSLRRA